MRLGHFSRPAASRWKAAPPGAGSASPTSAIEPAPSPFTSNARADDLDLHQRVQDPAEFAVGIGELPRLLEVVWREDLGAARQPAHALQGGGENPALTAELRAVTDRPGDGDGATD